MSKRYRSRNFKALIAELDTMREEISALDSRHSGLENKVNVSGFVDWKSRESRLDDIDARMKDIQVQLSKLTESMLVVRNTDYEWFRKWMDDDE